MSLSGELALRRLKEFCETANLVLAKFSTEDDHTSAVSFVITGRLSFSSDMFRVDGDCGILKFAVKDINWPVTHVHEECIEAPKTNIEAEASQKLGMAFAQIEFLNSFKIDLLR